MPGQVSHALVAELEQRRLTTMRQAEALLTRCANEKRDLSPAETATHRGYIETIKGLTEHCNEIREDLQRSQIPEHLSNLGKPRRVNSGALVAPLSFPEEELRRLHPAVLRNESCRIQAERRDFSSVDSLLPPALYPVPLGPIYEPRLLDKLPAQGIDTPSLEYIQHTSTLDFRNYAAAAAQASW